VSADDQVGHRDRARMMRSKKHSGQIRQMVVQVCNIHQYGGHPVSAWSIVERAHEKYFLNYLANAVFQFFYVTPR
jgi:hypothetical protein